MGRAGFPIARSPVNKASMKTGGRGARQRRRGINERRYEPRGKCHRPTLRACNLGTSGRCIVLACGRICASPAFPAFPAASSREVKESRRPTRSFAFDASLPLSPLSPLSSISLLSLPLSSPRLSIARLAERSSSKIQATTRLAIRPVFQSSGRTWNEKESESVVFCLAVDTRPLLLLSVDFRRDGSARGSPRPGK